MYERLGTPAHNYFKRFRATSRDRNSPVSQHETTNYESGNQRQFLNISIQRKQGKLVDRKSTLPLQPN